MLYRLLLRPVLFLLSAESAHAVVSWALGLAHRIAWLRPLLGGRRPHDGTLTVSALGRSFASPVGLAAGFDKSAEMYNALGAVGFAFVEVGTVTALAQAGNPKPRLFRLRRDRALINRMGFNNLGAEAAARAIRAHPPDRVVLGINVGKSKLAPLEHAADDYAQSVRALAPFAHYLVVNVSSPNTPGLRSLQSVTSLREVLVAVRSALSAAGHSPPVLVKIAPDLADDDIDAIVDLALELRIEGIVAANTTIGRTGLVTPEPDVAALGAGGLSGPVLFSRTREIVRRVRRRAGARLVIVGVGGVATVDDVYELLRAGATLVQVYTALVYGGPGFARELNDGLATRLRSRGVANVAEIVGESATVEAESTPIAAVTSPST